MIELSDFPESKSVRPIVIPEDELWRLATPPWAGQIDLESIKDENELPADPIERIITGMKTMEQRKQEFDELHERRQRESTLPRPFKLIGNLAIRLARFRDRMIPAMRPENDFGDRHVGGYNGSVKGIDRIVTVMNNHKAGRLTTEKSETNR